MCTALLDDVQAAEPNPKRKLPLSERRLAANRANAQKSTGPRTKEGKSRSRMNALKHGMCSASPLLPNECPATFETIKAELDQEFQPNTALSKTLFDQFIRSVWATHRLADIERELFVEEHK